MPSFQLDLSPLQARHPMLLGASPVVRQQCGCNQEVELDRSEVEVYPGVDHSTASCVGFKTPLVERSSTVRQGPAREQCTTPACGGIVLESDDNITPMPAYRTMPTPILKVHRLIALVYCFLLPTLSPSI